MIEPPVMALSPADVPSIGWSAAGDRLGVTSVEPLPLSGSPAVPIPPRFLRGIDSDSAARRMPAQGDPRLLQLLGRHFLERAGVELDPSSEIVVTNGAMQALDCVFRALIPDGAKVGFITPTFFADRLLGDRVQIVTFDTHPEDGWHLTDRVLDQVGAAELDVLFLVNPNNPTGVVYGEDELRALAAVTADTLLIVDEAYEAFVFCGRPHVSMQAIGDCRDRVVTVQSFTKSFGLVSARVGCVTGPAPLIAPVRRLLGWLTLASNPLSQALAIAALEAGEEWRRLLVGQFETNRRALEEAVVHGGLPAGTGVPEGATFSTLDIATLGVGSEEAARLVWSQTGIACVPGSEFPGNVVVTDRFLRLPLGAPEDVFVEALDRLKGVFS